jgi:hypothetical protein
MREGASRLVRAFFYVPEKPHFPTIHGPVPSERDLLIKTADPDNLSPSGSVHPLGSIERAAQKRPKEALAKIGRPLRQTKLG